MSRFLIRLLTFTILLGAIPVIFIGLISYSIASDDLERKVMESNKQVLLQTQMRVEQAMRTLELSAIQFASSPLVSKSVPQALTAEQYQPIKDLSTGLYGMQTFAGINEAYLISLDQDWSISFRSFKPFNALENRDLFASYVKLPNSLTWLTGDQTGEARAQDEPTEDEASSRSPIRMIRMVLKLPFIPQADRPQGLLVAEMPDGELKQLLAENPKLGEFLVLDESGRDFLADGQMTPRTAIARETFAAAHGDGAQEGFVHTERDGEPVLVTYRTSEYNGWIYASVVSIQEITKQTRSIAWITFVACAALLLAVTGFGYYGSRRMYSPVRRLFEFTKQIDSGDTPESKKQDEFTLIEDRLRKLSSTGRELQQQVRGQFPQLKEFFVLKLFSGQMTESDFAYRSAMYGLPTGWKRLGVLTLQIDSLQGTRYGEHDRELLLFAVNNMVGELIPPERRFSPVVLNQSQVTLLTSELLDEAEWKAEQHRLASVIQEKIGEFLQLQVSIGISRPFERTGEAMKGYHESLEALKGRIRLGSDLIIYAGDLESGQELKAAIYAQLKFVEDQLVQAVKQGDREKAESIFGEYIAAIAGREIHFNEYPVLMLQLVAKLFQLVHEQGSSVQKALGERASVEHFMSLRTLDAIIRWFQADLLEPLFAFLGAQAETQYVDIANRMVNMIQERYTEDLSLELCAAELNFHPVYLSRVFKKETGVNYVDYLMEYRMKMAKNWLETTNDKVSEIAERLRYTNTSAFIRTFRRIVGVTPGQYREQEGNR